MIWLLIALGLVAALLLVAVWRLSGRSEQRVDPAAYQVMADLYAIRRRLDVALFRLRLSGDMAEARRRLSTELDTQDVERSRKP